MMKKLSLLSRITFVIFLLLLVAALTGCAGLKTSPDVDDKRAQAIKRCSELHVKNREKDDAWKLYKVNTTTPYYEVDESGQCVPKQDGDGCSIAIADGVCITPPPYEKSAFAKFKDWSDKKESESLLFKTILGMPKFIGFLLRYGLIK